MAHRADTDEIARLELARHGEEAGNEEEAVPA
jgi:hypothetical protein